MEYHLHNRHPLTRFILRHRSELLMWALIGQMIASPAADYHPLIGAGLAVLVLVFLLAGLTYMGSRKILLRLVLPITAFWLVARLIEAFVSRTHWYANLAPIFGLMLSCSILWAIFERFNSSPQIPRNAIAEAFINYLIIAIAFSQLYWILSRFVPNPFNQPIPETHNGTLLYFSMVTLSGVGYGGIAPLNPYIRIVAALETMAGIFYIAVVVARLVSAYRPNSVAPAHHTPNPANHGPRT
jgi:voltage-gated potassium channel